MRIDTRWEGYGARAAERDTLSSLSGPLPISEPCWGR
jgi:hypothetical protein